MKVKVCFFFLIGLKLEGFYRVFGFTEYIEDVKMVFDRGRFVFFWMLNDLFLVFFFLELDFIYSGNGVLELLRVVF